jgi:hypothetical protein
MTGARAEQASSAVPLGRLVARASELAVEENGKWRRLSPSEAAFKTEMDFEPSSALAIPGERFAIKVYLKNLDGQSLELTDMTVTLRLNREGLGEKLMPLARRVESEQRVLIGVINGSWPLAVGSWVAVVDVASGPQHCLGRIALVR